MCLPWLFLARSTTALVSATPDLVAVLSKNKRMLSLLKSQSASSASSAGDEWLPFAIAALTHEKEVVAQDLKYKAKALSAAQTESHEIAYRLVRLRDQEGKVENDKKIAASSAPSAVLACKHRCKDKTACSHPCCKVIPVEPLDNPEESEQEDSPRARSAAEIALESLLSAANDKVGTLQLDKTLLASTLRQASIRLVSKSFTAAEKANAKESTAGGMPSAVVGDKELHAFYLDLLTFNNSVEQNDLFARILDSLHSVVANQATTNAYWIHKISAVVKVCTWVFRLPSTPSSHLEILQTTALTKMASQSKDLALVRLSVPKEPHITFFDRCVSQFLLAAHAMSATEDPKNALAAIASQDLSTPSSLKSTRLQPLFRNSKKPFRSALSSDDEEEEEEEPTRQPKKSRTSASSLELTPPGTKDFFFETLGALKDIGHENVCFRNYTGRECHRFPCKFPDHGRMNSHGQPCPNLATGCAAFFSSDGCQYSHFVNY